MVYWHNWLWFCLQSWSRQHLAFIPEWSPNHSLGRSKPCHSAALSHWPSQKGHWRNHHSPNTWSVFGWRKGNPTQPCRKYTNFSGLYCPGGTRPSAPTRREGQGGPWSTVTHTYRSHTDADPRIHREPCEHCCTDAYRHLLIRSAHFPRHTDT